MKKPKEPIKPTKPELKIKSEIKKITKINAKTSLKDIIDNCDRTILKDLYIKQMRSGYYNSTVYLVRKTDAKPTDKELVKYEKQMKQYNIDIAKYKEDMQKFKEQLIKWTNFELDSSD